MIRFGKAVVRFRIPILILGFLLLIPAVIGYVNTRVNYDILSYLPSDIDTMKGQDILMNDFGTGAFSMMVVEDMKSKDVKTLCKKIEKVEDVKTVLSYDSLVDASIPKELLSEEFLSNFQNGEDKLVMIIYKETTSAEGTMQAIRDIRKIGDEQCFLSGMSAVVTDTKALSEKETAMYVLIAAVLSIIVLGVTMDSFLVPVFFMASIGMAIVYNLGSNYFFGEISFITKALTAVLQLGVTMDYSIFLWHSYQEQKVRFDGDKARAMGHAISNTISSVVGSSITTVAGFIALCFMSFTLGMDLGVVMAKGVVIGVICCITILPAMIMTFDKALVKTTHKEVLPSLHRVSEFVTRHYIIFTAIMLVLLVPALYGYNHTKVYYQLDATLPKELKSIQANEKLQHTFDMNSTHMVLVRSDLKAKDAKVMMDEMESLDGVKWAMGLDAVIGPSFPRELLPESLVEAIKNDKYQVMLVNSQYQVASDEVNEQVDQLEKIVKKYDNMGMLVGEAPCTRDLISITDEDFKMVSIVSIGAIFIIIALVFKSLILPVLLVAVIEFAIFINMGIPFYTNTTLPFIASVVIGTIQLGATVDYAILMTTRYKKERGLGKPKKEAIIIAHGASIKSIIISALSFFAATIGVGLYSSIDMIGSLCILMSRGALISMFVVACILPSVFMLFDRLICTLSIGFGPGKKKEEIV